MINSKKLKERAKELGVRQKDIAAAVGLRQSSVNLKINNLRPMTLDEAETIANLLKIEDHELNSYFFLTRVAQSNKLSGVR